MNRFTSILFLLLCSFFLSACNTKKDLATFSPQAARAEQTAVYIYRPNAMPNAVYSPGLTIDGEFKLYIKNGVNSRLTLTPGKHVLEFQNDKNYSELKPLSLIFNTGKVYFIRASTTLKINAATSYEPYVRSFSLTLIDKNQAIKEIAACCMNHNKNLNKGKKTVSTEKETSDGFSVDKTQNPFSH